MYNTIKNHESGIIHAANSDPPYRGTPYSVCRIVEPYLKNFTVHKYRNVSMRNSMVTCKNCQKSLRLMSKICNTCYYDLPNDPACLACSDESNWRSKVQDSELLILLKDSLRLMKKSGGFIKDAPIFKRLEKAISQGGRI